MSHPGVVEDAEVELIRTERAYQGRFLRVEVDEVRLPGGSLARLESVRHPGAAAVLPFVDANRILLLRQYRHSLGGWIREIPAGKLDPGEPPAGCAAREVEEEVGRRPGRLEELGSIFASPGFTDEVIWLYAAYDLVATRSAHEQDEVIEVETWPFDEALAAVRDGRICDAKSVAAILQAAMRRARQ